MAALDISCGLFLELLIKSVINQPGASVRIPAWKHCNVSKAKKEKATFASEDARVQQKSAVKQPCAEHLQV